MRKLIQKLAGNETGLTLVESLVALAILGFIAAASLTALGTGAKATLIGNEQAIAESLSRSEIEYIKSINYSLTDPYPINPELEVPAGWSVSTAHTTAHGTEDGVQKVTINVTHEGKPVLSLSAYKIQIITVP